MGERLLSKVREAALPGPAFDELIDRVAGREIDPYSAAQAVIRRLEVR
jgi:hypothetical protein